MLGIFCLNILLDSLEEAVDRMNGRASHEAVCTLHEES